jgi:hypothetical protein
MRKNPTSFGDFTVVGISAFEMIQMAICPWKTKKYVEVTKSISENE